MAQNDTVKPSTKKPTFHKWDLFIRLSKTAFTLCLLFTLSLIIVTAFFHRPDSPGPTHWFPFHSTSPPHTCHFNSSDPNPNPTPTHLSHILFSLSGSAKTWADRSNFTHLWWNLNSTRGFVFLDEIPNRTETSPSLPFRVSTRKETDMVSDRIARILKESFELKLPNIRWFVMGDDDTIFFTHNLVTVLSKYDYRKMYYVGSTSESVEQNVMHGYETAFGGGGFAVSYSLACELVRILDGCIDRYHSFYGSDEKISACVAELGVPLTREPGFHQLDVRDDPYGLLAAHPVAPLVSLHHLDSVNPLFPSETQVNSLTRLVNAYNVDPGHILQQSFCYDRRHKWSVSISWGYTAQLYPSLVPSKVLSMPLQTFRTWRSWGDGPFVFNTRPVMTDPCEQPIIYYLDQIEEMDHGQTITTYKKFVATTGLKCNRTAYKYAASVEKITVSASKTTPEKWIQAPRRECCEIADSWSLKRNMRVKIRTCRPGETITM